MDIRDLLVYSNNCRAALRETLEANPEVLDRPIGTMSRYNTVRLLLAHSMAAEERWIEKRIGGREIVDYEERAGATVAALYDDWDAIRERTVAFMDGLGPDDLAHTLHLTLGSRELAVTVEQVLFQIFNHETHHRAQISMALQQMGVDPPDFDYVLHHLRHG